MNKNYLDNKITIIYSLLLVYFFLLVPIQPYTLTFFLNPVTNISEKLKIGTVIIGIIFLIIFNISRLKKKFQIEFIVLLIFFTIQLLLDFLSPNSTIVHYKNGFILPIICILLIIFFQNAANENELLLRKIFSNFFFLMTVFFFILISFFLYNTFLKFFSSEKIFYEFAEDFYFINNINIFGFDINTIKLFNFSLPLPNGNGISRMLIIFYFFFIIKFFVSKLSKPKYLILSIFIIVINSFIFLLQSKLACIFMLMATPIIIFIFHRLNVKFFIFLFIFVIIPIINSYLIYKLKFKIINSEPEIQKKINYTNFINLRSGNEFLQKINTINYNVEIKSLSTYLSSRRVFSPLLNYFRTFNEKDVSLKNTIISKNLNVFFSGRNELFIKILQLSKNKLIIGHGISSDRILLNGNSASNAILYSLLSTGLLGFCVLIFFYYLLFLNLRKIFKEIQNYNHKNLFYFVITLFIIFRSLVENSFATWNLDLIIILMILLKINLRKFRNS